MIIALKSFLAFLVWELLILPRYFTVKVFYPLGSPFTDPLDNIINMKNEMLSSKQCQIIIYFH